MFGIFLLFHFRLENLSKQRKNELKQKQNPDGGKGKKQETGDSESEDNDDDAMFQRFYKLEAENTVRSLYHTALY